MALLDPELLASMRDLPLAVLGGGVVIGVSLGVSGWWLHRFWITLIATLIGGMAGLMYGPQLGVKQAVVAGVLLAMASGCLALSLARVALFLIYGMATWYAASLVTPQWAAPLICITVGGLVSVFCFRYSMSLLTCALSSLILAYSGLVLADLFLQFKAAPYLKEYPWSEFLLLGLLTLLGVGLQLRLHRAQQRAVLRKLEQDERYGRRDTLPYPDDGAFDLERRHAASLRRGWRLFGRRRAG